MQYLKMSYIKEYSIANNLFNYMKFSWYKVKRTVSIYFTDIFKPSTIAEYLCIILFSR